VADVLKPAQPLAGALWPAGGALDQRTLQDVAANGTTTVLVDPAHLHNRQGEEPYTLGGVAAPGNVRALAIDPLVSTFLGGGQDERRPLSTQNGLAALTYEAAFAGPAAARGRSILVAPPRRWAAPAGELDVFLRTVEAMLSGMAQPRSLTDAVAAAPRGTVTDLSYGTGDSSSEIVPSVTAELVRLNTARRDLVESMKLDDTAQVDPQGLVTPLQFGLLRAASTAWRGPGAGADRAVGEVSAELDALRGQVTVVNQGRPLTLASGNSPIPVLLSNALPVAVVVRIKLSDVPGLRPEQFPDVVIPARGSINRPLPAEVTRSGRFTIDVSLSTPGGTPLGSTARYELTSTAYGSVTLIITGVAAVALLLLVARRLYRRMRAARTGEPAPSQGGAA